MTSYDVVWSCMMLYDVIILPIPLINQFISKRLVRYNKQENGIQTNINALIW